MRIALALRNYFLKKSYYQLISCPTLLPEQEFFSIVNWKECVEAPFIVMHWEISGLADIEYKKCKVYGSNWKMVIE